MNLIPIKKSKISKGDEQVEVYIVAAMSIAQSDGKVKKVPHPEGKDTIIFSSLEKAKDAVNLAGFSYTMYKSELSVNNSNYDDNSDFNKIIGSLLELLDDKSTHVVAAAIFSLGEISCTEAIDPLVSILHREDPAIRKNTIDALVKIGTPAVAKLIKALDDENWITRDSAAMCLGEMADQSSVNLSGAINNLIARLNDVNPIVKSSAAIALGKICRNIKNKKINI